MTTPANSGMVPVGPRIDHEVKKKGRFWKTFREIGHDVIEEMSHLTPRDQANKTFMDIIDDDEEISEPTHAQWKYDAIKMGAYIGLMGIGIGINHLANRVDFVSMAQKMEGEFWNPVRRFAHKHQRMIRYAQAQIFDVGSAGIINAASQMALKDRNAYVVSPSAQIAAALIDSVPEVGQYINAIGIEAFLGMLQTGMSMAGKGKESGQMLDNIDGIIFGERTPENATEGILYYGVKVAEFYAARKIAIKRQDINRGVPSYFQVETIRRIIKAQQRLRRT